MLVLISRFFGKTLEVSYISCLIKRPFVLQDVEYLDTNGLGYIRFRDVM